MKNRLVTWLTYLTFPRRAIERSGLFDRAWYLGRYPDVAALGVDPLTHYLRHGEGEGRDPSGRFETAVYHRVLADHGVEARGGLLGHYVTQGRSRGWAATAADQRTSRGDLPWAALQRSQDPAFEAEPLDAGPVPPGRPLLWAFHLPQFHPIPENDGWWGPGFTEWRNVVRGLPRFPGHDQPRQPRDFGFYDLSGIEGLERQAQAAKRAGLAGFCFYYYWFNGQRLLQRPVENLLKHPEVELPFFLMWANENWTRTWDGMNQEVLISQDYREDQDEALVDDWARHFADPRYWRWNGRPVFLLYRPGLIPQAAVRIARWRDLLRQRHGLEVWMAMAQGFGDHDPRPYGLDGAFEFPPHKLAADLPKAEASTRPWDPGFAGNYYEYRDLVARSLAVEDPGFPLLRTAVPSWDNEARRPGRGGGAVGSTPGLFQSWVGQLIEATAQKPDDRPAAVFLNAWNEWAEGTYLEPDLRYGWAYLNAAARALRGLTPSSKAGVLLVGHDAHPHGSQLLLLHIAQTLSQDFGLEVRVLLLEGGPLLERYAALVPVVVAPTAEAWAVEAASRPGIPVLTNTVVTGDAAAWFASRGHRVVSLVHEMEGLMMARGLGSRARALASSAHVVLTASSVVQTSFEKVAGPCPQGRQRPQGLYFPQVAPSASAREGFRRQWGIDPTAKVILGVGYADHRKGFDWFAGLAARNTRADWVYLWVGHLDTSWAPQVLAELPAGKGPLLVPFTDDPAAAYAAADVFALTSREDPYPTVVLEAQAAGLPVVAFAGSGGWAGPVAPGDLAAFEAALAEALASDSPEARRQRREGVLARHDWRDYVWDLWKALSPGAVQVSAAVLSYNYKPYLAERLTSIFRQSAPVFEVVVFDDGSQDGSVEEAERLASQARRRLRVVRNEANSGSAFAQWARAARECRGDYLWIAEADDGADPALIEALTAGEGPAPTLTWCDSRAVDGQGRAVGASYKPWLAEFGGRFDHDFEMEGARFCAQILAYKNAILNVSAALWRRQDLVAAVDRLGPEWFTWRAAGDWRVYLEALDQPGARVRYREAALNVHRRHGTSLTGGLQAQKHLAEIEAIQAWCRGRHEVDEARQGRILAEARTSLGAD